MLRARRYERIFCTGGGGTIVYDPPVLSSSSQKVAALNGQSKSATTSDFTGTVSDFGGADLIDLPGIGFSDKTTLGYLPNGNRTGGTSSVADSIDSADIALLGNCMASIFAMSSVNHGGAMTTVAEIVQPNDHSVLSNPLHA